MSGRDRIQNSAYGFNVSIWRFLLLFTASDYSVSCQAHPVRMWGFNFKINSLN